MTSDKIPNLLKKLDALLQGTSQLSRLEKDLARDYLRELYDLVEGIPTKSQYSAPLSTPVATTISSPQPEVVTKEAVPPPTVMPSEPRQAALLEDKSVATEAPLVEDREVEAASYKPATKTDTLPHTPHDTKQNGLESAALNGEKMSSAQVAEILTARVAISTAHQSLFITNRGHELSDKLARVPVTDLRRALSINDRLQVISELFCGDREAFQETLDILNSKFSFEEAKVYLTRYVIDRYRWLDEEKTEQAREFIHLVERRFLT